MLFRYLAPEILLNKGHGKAVDWWSLGILLCVACSKLQSCHAHSRSLISYEMIFGLPPFYSENLNEMYRGIISAPLTFPSDFPVAQELQDIIRGFLTRDPQVITCPILQLRFQNHLESQTRLSSAVSDRKMILQKVF
jgi:serine/threonine protein kinase